MTEAKTPQQNAVLLAVRDLYASRGFSPTIREIAARTGLHKSRVGEHLERLRQQGLITWEVGKSRTITPRTKKRGALVNFTT